MNYSYRPIIVGYTEEKHFVNPEMIQKNNASNAINRPGFDYELFDFVCQATNIPCIYREIPDNLSVLVHMLANGSIDALLNSVDVIPVYTEVLNLKPTVHMFEFHEILVASKRQPELLSSLFSFFNYKLILSFFLTCLTATVIQLSPIMFLYNYGHMLGQSYPDSILQRPYGILERPHGSVLRLAWIMSCLALLFKIEVSTNFVPQRIVQYDRLPFYDLKSLIPLIERGEWRICGTGALFEESLWVDYGVDAETSENFPIIQNQEGTIDEALNCIRKHPRLVTWLSSFEFWVAQNGSSFKEYQFVKDGLPIGPLRTSNITWSFLFGANYSQVAEKFSSIALYHLEAFHTIASRYSHKRREHIGSLGNLQALPINDLLVIFNCLAIGTAVGLPLLLCELLMNRQIKSRQKNEQKRSLKLRTLVTTTRMHQYVATEL